jgi:hypothetical protein
MSIGRYFVFYPGFFNNATGVIVPGETEVELNFLYQLVCVFPCSSAVANETTYLTFDPELLFLLESCKVNII